MRMHLEHLWLTGAAVVVFGWIGQASADHVTPIIGQSGKETCSTTLANFGTLTERNETTVLAGGTERIFVGDAVVDVTVSADGTTLDWESVSPDGILPPVEVNCVILKGGPQGTNQYLYLDPPEVKDESLVAPGGAKISQYNIGVELEISVEDTPLADCEQDFGQTCPADGTPLVRTEWNPDNPNELDACTCNVVFKACDLRPDDGDNPNPCFPVMVDEETGDLIPVRGLRQTPLIAKFFDTPACLSLSTGGTGRGFCP